MNLRNSGLLFLPFVLGRGGSVDAVEVGLPHEHDTFPVAAVLRTEPCNVVGIATAPHTLLLFQQLQHSDTQTLNTFWMNSEPVRVLGTHTQLIARVR